MKNFLVGSIDRIMTIHLGRGELLLESLLNALQTEHIENAVLLGAIGSLQKTSFHRVITKDTKPMDEYLTVTTPCEISSAQGIILSGEPHIHFVFSDTERTYTGHLERGTEVLYLVELTVAELSGCDIKRLKDQNNIAYFSKI